MKTVNDFIMQYGEHNGFIDIIIRGIMPDDCLVEDYYKGNLLNIPKKLRSVELKEVCWSFSEQMWVLCVQRDSSFVSYGLED